jgi:hypothetical protein
MPVQSVIGQDSVAKSPKTSQNAQQGILNAALASVAAQLIQQQLTHLKLHLTASRLKVILRLVSFWFANNVFLILPINCLP